MAWYPKLLGRNGLVKLGGTTITPDAAEVNRLDGVTAGTVTASKVAVPDANKDIGDFRNLDAVNIDAGASGTAGSVDVFPATASKGKLAITCTDQTGNTTVTLTAGAMGQATAVQIADPGVAASYVVQTSSAKTAAVADLLAVGVAAGYKVARGVSAVTGTLAITTGLATVVAVSAVLAEDAALTGTLVTATIPAQAGGDAGKFTAKVWKPTAAGDCTPVAADAAKSVSWIAIGT